MQNFFDARLVVVRDVVDGQGGDGLRRAHAPPDAGLVPLDDVRREARLEVERVEEDDDGRGEAGPEARTRGPRRERQRARHQAADDQDQDLDLREEAAAKAGPKSGTPAVDAAELDGGDDRPRHEPHDRRLLRDGRRAALDEVHVRVDARRWRSQPCTSPRQEGLPASERI